MAPSSSLYTLSLAGFANTGNQIIEGCEYLIENYNVQVINISYGSNGDGDYNAFSAELDTIVKNNKVTLVFSVGNSIYNINSYAMGPNSIAVGNVLSNGTTNTATNAYVYYYNKNAYVENAGVINRPDICAPGYVNIYSTENSGTSFSAPHVTGTIIQMISRNAGLSDKPTILKAALVASGTYGPNCSTSYYIENSIICDKCGGGVVDASFCYQVAKNGRRTHFDMAPYTTTCTYDVYCDTIDKTFRVACSWEVDSVVTSEADDDDINGTGKVYCNDYNMELYKDGQLVATSSAPSASSTGATTNCELIELSTEELSEYGAGYYQVKIVRNGSAKWSSSIRIGLAWEQP